MKPYPFYFGIVFVLLSLVISWVVVRDTKKFTLLEIRENKEETIASTTGDKDNKEIEGDFKDVFVETSWKNRTLLAVSQAGFVNNLVFGVTWGIFTLYFASIGLATNEIGFLKALHPGIWAISDVSHPKWRATSLGVYRFWRDLGFVFGAIGIGFLADIVNVSIPIQVSGLLALGSGIFVFLTMRETKKIE